MPLVSVIIPVYNSEKTIGETIESVLNQTWQNIEVIIINDGSNDRTEAIILKYARDHRIKYIYQSNRGCSNAKNTGLKASTGDYLQYLDADDIISANKIELQLEALCSNPSAIAICRTIKFHNKINDHKENEIDTAHLYSTNDPIGFLLNLYGLNGRVGMIQPNAFLISKSISEKAGIWDESISPSPDEDGEYFCRIILNASSIIYTPTPINYYRVGLPNSLSKQHSYEYVKGGLRSLIRKKAHILAAENSERTRLAVAISFSNFEYQYYNLYPDLMDLADNELKKIGYSNKVPITGGKKFRLLGILVGMKNALKIRKAWHVD